MSVTHVVLHSFGCDEIPVSSSHISPGNANPPKRCRARLIGAAGTTNSQNSKFKHTLDPVLRFISPSASAASLLGGFFTFAWLDFLIFAGWKSIPRQQQQRVSDLADVLKPADQHRSASSSL